MDWFTELHHRLSEIGTHVALAAAVGGIPSELRDCLHHLHDDLTRTRQRLMCGGEDAVRGSLQALEADTERACAMCGKPCRPHALPTATLDEARREIRELRRLVELAD